ncbi:putative ring finger domain-containing protein [Diplodia seriata]|uniref:Putative ring finger domain-containing protein n=1 Tax=Diplodia seriata TaxID=420778 RepID=A0A0G2GI85_9PEZI|nr:putative ring finger domain-containing protein [Diplodia seriata]
MVVIGFEDRDSGQRRVVTKDLVGGLAMKDNALLKNAPTAAPSATDNPGTPTAPAPAVAPPPPDPAAAGAISPVDAPHAWRWRDTDGTIKKARMRAGLFRSNSASSASSSSMQRDGNKSKSNNASSATTAADTTNNNNVGGGGGGSSNANTTNNSNGSTNNNNNASNANPTSNPTSNPSTTTNNNSGPAAAGLILKKQFPPDGGLGLRVLALWSYWPQEGVNDELMFPKGAEIREAEDINGDWYWGCYCGRKGLFPGNYVRGN